MDRKDQPLTYNRMPRSFWHSRIGRAVQFWFRLVIRKLRMRPQRWWSWRHHRLALAVGYFTLGYSSLEQEFVEQAGGLAISRGHTYSTLDKQAEYEAYAQAQSIEGSEYKKAKLWAKHARQNGS